MAPTDISSHPSTQPSPAARKTILWFVNQDIDISSVGALNAEGHGWLASTLNVLTDRYDLVIVSVDPYKADIRGGHLSKRYLRPAHWRLKLLASLFFDLPDREGDLLDQMKRIVDDVRPDLIHIHGTEKPFMRIHAHARERGIPVMVSLQGIMSAIHSQYAKGYSIPFLRRTIGRWGWRDKALLPQTLLPAYLRTERQADLERRHLPHVEVISGRTEWDRRIAKLMNPTAVYVRIDRVLKPAFYDANWSWTPTALGSPFVIHTTTGNAIYKGFELICESLALLQASGLEVEWRVAGLTDRDEAVRAAKRKLGRRYPRRGLMLQGKRSAQELVQSMLKAHIYVSASHIENSPNNLAEAMMVGMPCVATFAGGTSSYVTDDVDGLLVQPGDPFGMAGAIRELLLDRAKAERLGQHARRSALRRHDPAIVRDQTMRAYHDLLVDA